MMEQREKLIELLDIAFLDSDDNYGMPNTGQVADNLIANGVVVPVRCRECVYWQSGENEAEKWEYCRRHRIDIGPHSFCSHGERSRE